MIGSSVPAAVTLGSVVVPWCLDRADASVPGILAPAALRAVGMCSERPALIPRPVILNQQVGLQMGSQIIGKTIYLLMIIKHYVKITAA